MAATWALAASPWGVRVLSLVPLTIPAPQAHCMGEIAYSLKSAKPGKAGDAAIWRGRVWIEHTWDRGDAAPHRV